MWILVLTWWLSEVRRLIGRAASGEKRTVRADIASQFDFRSIIDITKMFGSKVE